MLYESKSKLKFNVSVCVWQDLNFLARVSHFLRIDMHAFTESKLNLEISAFKIMITMYYLFTNKQISFIQQCVAMSVVCIYICVKFKSSLILNSSKNSIRQLKYIMYVHTFDLKLKIFICSERYELFKKLIE
jgi:hypothetical protein